MYKLAVLPLLFAVASAGYIGAPLAAPLAYSAPAVAPVAYASHAYSAPVAYASHAYSAPAPVAYASHAYAAPAPVAYASHAYSAPVTYSAPAVVKTVAAPVATSYQNTYKVSRSGVAVAPAVATYAAAPAVATYAAAAPALATYSAAPAVATYAAAAPAVSYSAPLLRTGAVGYGYAAPTLLH